MTNLPRLHRPLNLSKLEKPTSSWPMISWPYIATAAILLLILICSPNFKAVSSPAASPFAGDFLQEWIAGRMLREGDAGRFYDPEYAKEWEHRVDIVGLDWKHDDYFPMVYPPFYYGLVSPISLLPFTIAAYVWLGLMVLAYLAAWRIFIGPHLLREGGVIWKDCVIREGEAPAEPIDNAIFITASGSAGASPSRIKTDGASPAHAQPPRINTQNLLWLLPLSLIFMPLIESLTSCQKGTVLLLILTSTYALLVRGNSFSAGLVFGLIAFKPQFALPIAIAMLCKQQWRFVLGGLTTGLILGGSCLLMGFDLCSQYVAFSLHATDYIQTGGYDLTKSHAFYGFFTQLVGHGHVTLLVKILTLLAMLSTIGIISLGLRGPLLPQQPRFQHQFSLLILGTILLSPHVYTYDLTILLLPLGLLAHQALTADKSHPPSNSLTWLALLLFTLTGLSPQIAASTGLQITVPLMVGMMVILSGYHRETEFNDGRSQSTFA